MKLKITYESGDEIVTITWTPEYGFDIAGNKTIVDKFTTEEIQPRGSAVAAVFPAPPDGPTVIHQMQVPRPNVGTDPGGKSNPNEGQVVVTRDGEQVWVDPEDLTEEEQEAAEQAQAAIDKAIAEAAGDPDDDGEGKETPTPAAMPKKAPGKRKSRAKPKCQACNHAWHNEECQVLIGTDQTKQPCGCLTAVM